MSVWSFSEQLGETFSERSHLPSGNLAGIVCVQQSTRKIHTDIQMDYTHDFIHWLNIVHNNNLQTYITAILGEDCQHHFCKLHRLHKSRTLADELFNELCEQFFTQVGLEKRQYSVTMKIMPKQSCSIFPTNKTWWLPWTRASCG